MFSVDRWWWRQLEDWRDWLIKGKDKHVVVLLSTGFSTMNTRTMLRYCGGSGHDSEWARNVRSLRQRGRCSSSCFRNKMCLRTYLKTCWLHNLIANTPPASGSPIKPSRRRGRKRVEARVPKLVAVQCTNPMGVCMEQTPAINHTWRLGIRPSSDTVYHHESSQVGWLHRFQPGKMYDIRRE